MVRVDQPLRDAPADGVRAHASRLRILQTLRQHPDGLGAQDVATAVGLHLNTVRFHLDRLVADGVVNSHAEDRTEPGRPRLNYAAVGLPGSHGDTRSYRLLAAMLAALISESVPKAAEAARAAGQVWGGHLAERPDRSRRSDEDDAISQLLRILDEVGFDPQLTPELGVGEGSRAIHLHHCPFLEIAKEHRDIVCSMHLGLMQGALAEMQASVTVRRLEAFVKPSLCVATLAKVPAGDAAEDN